MTEGLFSSVLPAAVLMTLIPEELPATFAVTLIVGESVPSSVPIVKPDVASRSMTLMYVLLVERPDAFSTVIFDVPWIFAVEPVNLIAWNWVASSPLSMVKVEPPSALIKAAFAISDWTVVAVILPAPPAEASLMVSVALLARLNAVPPAAVIV